MIIRQNTTGGKFDIATIATWHRNLFEANVTRYPNIPGTQRLTIKMSQVTTVNLNNKISYLLYIIAHTPFILKDVCAIILLFINKIG